MIFFLFVYLLLRGLGKYELLENKIQPAFGFKSVVELWDKGFSLEHTNFGSDTR